MTRIALRLTAAAAVLVVAAGCSHDPAEPSASPTAPSAAAATSPGLTTPSSPASAAASSGAADTEGCSWGEETNPTHFDIPARGISQPVVGVGLDKDGNVGAPPDKFSVAWWTAGPRVGSEQGHVILTVHTWTGDVALGNILEDSTKGLHAGDVIRMSDGDKTVCYRYKDMKTIKVADYDRNSTVWINPAGDPQLTIMICADYNTRTGEWDSRHVFFADPIKP